MLAPTVYSMAPCCPADATAEDKVVVCLVTSFFPNDITIQWVPEEPDDAKPAPAPPSTILKTKNAVYMGSRHVTVTGDSQALRCRVRHPPSNLTVFKPVPKDGCTAATPPPPPPPPPRVYLVEPGCGEEGGETEVSVLCVVWSAAGSGLEVSWLVNGKDVRRPLSEGADGGQSELRMSRKSWEAGDVYTCQVRWAAGGAVMRNGSRCTACLASLPPPQLYITQPSYAELLAGPANASCLLLGQHLRGAALSWRRGGTGGTLTRHPNGTQGLILNHTVSLDQWGVDFKLTCEANVPCHPRLSAEVLLGPPSGPRKPPQVTMTRVPGRADQGELLLCDISNFTPRDLTISWTSGSGGWDLSARAQTGPIAGQKLFSTLSILRLEKGEEGRDYSCVVHHPALNRPYHGNQGGDPTTLTPTPETTDKSSSHHGSPTPPLSSLQSPSFHELFLRQEANLTCSTPLANATVTWEAGTQLVDPEAVRTLPDEASGTRSWLRVSLRDWNSTANFSCRVQSGTEETRVEIRRRTGPLKPPSIHLLPSSPTASCAGQDFTLFCLVTDFYPPEVAVWWRQGSAEGPADKTPTCDHQAHRCSLVVTVDVPWEEWVRGAPYGCSAAHISTGEVTETTVNTRAEPWDCTRLRLVPCGLLGDGDDLEPEEDGSTWTTISTFVVLFLLLIFYSGFVTFIKVK